MVLFGLTGGVASGKSTVGARFRERGLEVIDADRVARQVVEPGTEGLAAVVNAFGQGVLGPDGSLDRKALGAVVFAHETERKRLNSILHPRIALATQQQAAALAERGVGVACYEAALLVENGLCEAFRPLVVVSLQASEQLRRLMERDRCSAAEAQRKIDAQLPLSEKVALADHVIDNSGTLARLLEQADEVLDAIHREHAQ